jgi:hypothetical protein
MSRSAQFLDHALRWCGDARDESGGERSRDGIRCADHVDGRPQQRLHLQLAAQRAADEGTLGSGCAGDGRSKDSWLYATSTSGPPSSNTSCFVPHTAAQRARSTWSARFAQLGASEPHAGRTAAAQAAQASSRMRVVMAWLCAV